MEKSDRVFNLRDVLNMEKITRFGNSFQLMSSSEILTRDIKTEAIYRINETGTYSSETQPAREANLEVDMLSENSMQKNLHMINKLMIASTADKEISS